MKYVLAIDSYKGSMTAEAACEAAAKGLCRADPHADCVLMPLADGGEGTASAMCAAMGGQVVDCTVEGPFGTPAKGYVGLVGKNGLSPALVVIDTAAASGLGLAKAHGLDPLSASTYGTGLQIAKALDLGCRNIVVGLGGSGTNDGGTGALAALGARFLDRSGALIEGRGGAILGQIHRIDLSGLHPALKEASLRLLFDVAIPLTGEHGCSLNYSAQKGATPEMMQRLEAGMVNYAEAIKRSLGIDPDSVPGTGAAGGLGCGLMLAGGKLVNGAPAMLEIAGFADKAKTADLIITGEGKTDEQTASGKLPVAVSRVAKQFGKPVVCLCGCADPTPAVYDEGIDAVFSITNRPMRLEDSLRNAEALMEEAAYNVGRLLLVARQ